VTPLAISAISFAFIFGGALGGIWLRLMLPDARLSSDAKDVVRLSMGLIATISAVVLGLLIASAKSAYDAKTTKLKEIAVSVILTDNMLAQYGPDALPARKSLRAAIGPSLERIWEDREGTKGGPFQISPEALTFYEAIHNLSPATDAQRAIHTRLVQLVTEIARERLALFAQAGNAIPGPFLAILVFWLAMIFASFSLFARAQPLIVVALFICCLSSAAAIFLILEMERPFNGIMAISAAPLRSALPPLP
jgi:hypothetical protein